MKTAITTLVYTTTKSANAYSATSVAIHQKPYSGIEFEPTKNLFSPKFVPNIDGSVI